MRAAAHFPLDRTKRKGQGPSPSFSLSTERIHCSAQELILGLARYVVVGFGGAKLPFQETSARGKRGKERGEGYNNDRIHRVKRAVSGRVACPLAANGWSVESDSDTRTEFEELLKIVNRFIERDLACSLRDLRDLFVADSSPFLSLLFSFPSGPCAFITSFFPPMVITTCRLYSFISSIQPWFRQIVERKRENGEKWKSIKFNFVSPLASLIFVYLTKPFPSVESGILNNLGIEIPVVIRGLLQKKKKKEKRRKKGKT